MRKLLAKGVFISLLLTGFSGAGQGVAEARLPSHFDIHITPTALAHPDPSVRIGAEFMTKNRWSYGISGGAAAFRQMRNDKRTNYIFYEVRPEIKFYWFQGNDIGWKLPQDMGCYFAMEGIYANSRYTIENSSFYADFEQITSFEKADFRKSKFGGVAKSGVKFLIGRKLSVDFYSGIGFARTDVAYSNVVNPQNKSEDTGFKAEDFYDGKKTIPQFVLGLKVGIRLWEE